MPLELQVKLLRVLETGTLHARRRRRRPIEVDVRVIAATNRDPSRRSPTASCARTCYYRLNVFPIHLPPLRERARRTSRCSPQHFLDELERARRRQQALRAATRSPRSDALPLAGQRARAAQRRPARLHHGAGDDDRRRLPAGDARRRGRRPAAAPTLDDPRRHAARGGRAPLILATLEHFGGHKEQTAADARHQPEDALQPAEGIRRRRRRPAQRAGRPRRGALRRARGAAAQAPRAGYGAQQAGQAAGLSGLTRNESKPAASARCWSSALA